MMAFAFAEASHRKGKEENQISRTVLRDFVGLEMLGLERFWSKESFSLVCFCFFGDWCYFKMGIIRICCCFLLRLVFSGEMSMFCLFCLG